MLVVARELTKAEVEQEQIVPGVWERYYSLYATDAAAATVVDVTDSRARKTFNFDVHTITNTQLTDRVVLPMLETILTPQRASQAVIVVDGTRAARQWTLFGSSVRETQQQPEGEQDTLASRDEGILLAALRELRRRTSVAAVYLGGVTLDDNNRLEDLFAPSADAGAASSSMEAHGAPPPASEPTVLEDMRDHFTAIEEACYQEVTDDARLTVLLARLRSVLSELKHQVVSIIVAFHDTATMPNVTVQFVSFAVGELARGMKSTRHCVSTAASLIECRSPVMPFNGTKLSYLLKPALLGHQPGAWVACLSPISFLPQEVYGGRAAALPSQQTPGVPERETFKEAFSIAQLASRIYSSRIGVLVPTPTLPPQPLLRGAPPTPRLSDADNTLSGSVLSASTGSAARGKSKQAGRRLQREMEAAEKSMTAPSQTSQLSRATNTENEGLVSTPSVKVSQETQTAAPGGGAAKQRCGPSASEFEAYRQAMESAMEGLRQRIRDDAGRLEKAEKDLATERSRAKRRDVESGAWVHRSTSAMDRLTAQNAALREELRAAKEALEVSKATHEQRLRSLRAESEAAHLRLTAEVTAALSRITQCPQRDPGTAEELAILKARVSELVDLVTYHQSEIRDHTEVEKRYRERILTLERTLRERTEDARGARRALELARDAQRGAEKRLATKSAGEVTLAIEEAGRGARAVRESEEAVTAMTERLQAALALAERERQARRASEAELAQLRARVAAESEAEERRERVTRQGYHSSTTGAAASPQVNYERQLADLQKEMTDFRARLSEQQQQQQRPEQEQQEPPMSVPRSSDHYSLSGIQVLSTSSTSGGYDSPLPPMRAPLSAAAAPSQRRPVSPTPSASLPPPPPPPPAVYVSSATHKQARWADESSVLTHRSTNSARGQRRSHERSRSFEDFMQQEPEYQLGQRVPMNFRTRSSRFRI